MTAIKLSARLKGKTRIAIALACICIGVAMYFSRLPFIFKALAIGLFLIAVDSLPSIYNRSSSKGTKVYTDQEIRQSVIQRSRHPISPLRSPVLWLSVLSTVIVCIVAAIRFIG